MQCNAIQSEPIFLDFFESNRLIKLFPSITNSVAIVVAFLVVSCVLVRDNIFTLANQNWFLFETSAKTVSCRRISMNRMLDQANCATLRNLRLTKLPYVALRRKLQMQFEDVCQAQVHICNRHLGLFADQISPLSCSIQELGNKSSPFPHLQPQPLSVDGVARP